MGQSLRGAVLATLRFYFIPFPEGIAVGAIGGTQYRLGVRSFAVQGGGVLAYVVLVIGHGECARRHIGSRLVHDVERAPVDSAHEVLVVGVGELVVVYAARLQDIEHKYAVLSGLEAHVGAAYRQGEGIAAAGVERSFVFVGGGAIALAGIGEDVVCTAVVRGVGLGVARDVSAGRFPRVEAAVVLAAEVAAVAVPAAVGHGDSRGYVLGAHRISYTRAKTIAYEIYGDVVDGQGVPGAARHGLLDTAVVVVSGDCGCDVAVGIDYGDGFLLFHRDVPVLVNGGVLGCVLCLCGEIRVTAERYLHTVGLVVDNGGEIAGVAVEERLRLREARVFGLLVDDEGRCEVEPLQVHDAFGQSVDGAVEVIGVARYERILERHLVDFVIGKVYALLLSALLLEHAGGRRISLAPDSEVAVDAGIEHIVRSVGRDAVIAYGHGAGRGQYRPVGSPAGGFPARVACVPELHLEPGDYVNRRAAQYSALSGEVKGAERGGVGLVVGIVLVYHRVVESL